MVRTKLTEKEKIAQNITGLETNAVNFNMANDVNALIEREKVNKFNDEVDQYVEKFSNHIEKLKQNQEILAEDIANVEIKPLFRRIIFVPFEHNPFQRIKQSDSGIIIDTGGMTPTHFNTDKGIEEDDKPDILTGVVQEIGPDVKYVGIGDVVFYRNMSAVPVPFYKQHFWSIDETQIIAIVNEGLTERFNNVKNG